MKKVVKWIGIVFGSLLALIFVAAVGLFFKGNSQLSKTYDFPPSGIIAPTDAASIERGRHKVETLCTGCHSADLGGVVGWTSVGPLASIDSANLTSGDGGIGQEFVTDEDYVRAIRHGIGTDGKPIYMPAVAAFQYFSDEDLGAIIAYLKSVPPVDRKTNGSQFTVLGKVIFATGMFGELPAETAGHENNVAAPVAGITIEYGEYLVKTGDCRACHGQELAGGAYPDPSVTQPVPNLTLGGELATWSEADFLKAMQTGVTPSGHQLDPDLMPWQETSLLSSEELQAIWLFLQSLPKLQQATQ